MLIPWPGPEVSSYRADVSQISSVKEATEARQSWTGWWGTCLLRKAEWASRPSLAPTWSPVNKHNTDWPKHPLPYASRCQEVCELLGQNRKWGWDPPWPWSLFCSPVAPFSNYQHPLNIPCQNFPGPMKSQVWRLFYVCTVSIESNEKQKVLCLCLFIYFFNTGAKTGRKQYSS